MELYEKAVKVQSLKIGMYVTDLDCPWTDTDFVLQGLLIKGHDDIEHLARFCKTVIVDRTKSHYPLTAVTFPANTLRPNQPNLNKPNITPTKNTSTSKSGPSVNRKIYGVNPNSNRDYIDPEVWKSRHCVEHYKISNSLIDEFKAATPLVALVEHQISHLVEKISAHKTFQIEPIVECTADLIESLVRNPDALAWICQIMKTRKPVYLHMIRLAVWGGIVGRQLGLNRFSLAHLSMTLMMTGIGKSLLKPEVLKNHNIYQHTPEYQEHLIETLYYLEQSHFSCEDIIGTIKNYCERHNGTGYPRGLSGSNIPFLARVAGLIDAYDGFVHPFETKQAVSPANAIARLNKLKGTLFDPPLVESFVQAMGIYPTGSLVEVNNGMLGIVVSQNHEKRVQASIIPLKRKDGSLFNRFKVIDLSLESSDKDDNKKLLIRRGLPSHMVPESLIAMAHQQLFEPKKNFLANSFIKQKIFKP